MTRYYKPIHNRRRLLIRIGIPAVVVILIIFTPIMSWLLGPGHVLARPFWWLSQSISGGTHSALQNLATKKSLLRDVNDLRAEVARLQSVDAQNRFLQEENTELQNLLHATPESKEGLLARVLVRPPTTWYDSLIVDRGEADFVQVGDRAYAYGTIPLGTVVAVTQHTATVELFSASSRKTDVVLIPGNIPVVAEGRGNSALHFNVHRDIAVDEQSSIILPNGELLASVDAVEFDPRDPFRSVHAIMPVNMQYLRFITIVPGSDL